MAAFAVRAVSCTCRGQNLTLESNTVEIQLGAVGGAQNRVVQGVRVTCVDCGRGTPAFSDGPIEAISKWNAYMEKQED